MQRNDTLRQFHTFFLANIGIFHILKDVYAKICVIYSKSKPLNIRPRQSYKTIIVIYEHLRNGKEATEKRPLDGSTYPG
jgi:hypothetical protein